MHGTTKEVLVKVSHFDLTIERFNVRAINKLPHKKLIIQLLQLLCV